MFVSTWVRIYTGCIQYILKVRCNHSQCLTKMFRSQRGKFCLTCTVLYNLRIVWLEYNQSVLCVKITLNPPYCVCKRNFTILCSLNLYFSRRAMKYSVSVIVQLFGSHTMMGCQKYFFNSLIIYTMMVGITGAHTNADVSAQIIILQVELALIPTKTIT